MAEPEKIRLRNTDAALVFKENGEVLLWIPQMDDDAIVPGNVQFIAMLACLIPSDPEFADMVGRRGESLVEAVEGQEVESSAENKDPGENAGAAGEDDDEVEIEPSDVALVVTRDWDVRAHFPLLREIGEDEDLPQHAVWAMYLAVLTRKDPDFVEMVCQRAQDVLGSGDEEEPE